VYIEYNNILLKYAEAKKNKKVSMPGPVKSLIAGGLAGITGLPLLYPLDSAITRKQVNSSKDAGNSVSKNFFKKHYGGVGLKALKIAPAMAIALTMNPIYKNLLDKYISTSDPILKVNK